MATASMEKNFEPTGRAQFVRRETINFLQKYAKICKVYDMLPLDSLDQTRVCFCRQATLIVVCSWRARQGFLNETLICHSPAGNLKLFGTAAQHVIQLAAFTNKYS
jgi:hypothetical protein